MVKWEKDPNAKINKEISDQYAVAPFMPGATMVPSAAPGNFGGQLGVDPEEPFVQILDPYEQGGGQVLDLRPKYRQRRAQRAPAPSQETAMQQLMSLGNPMQEQPPSFPQPPQFPAMPGPAQQVQLPQYGQPAMPPSLPSPMGLAGHPSNANGPWPAPEAPAFLPPPLPQMRHIPPPVQQAPAAPPQNAQQAPMEVQFHMPDGSQFICYYHALVRPEGSPAIMLVTDLRANGFAQRFIPPLSPRGAPMGIVVPVHNLSLWAYSVGVQFTFDNREFLVLFIAAEKAEPNGEDGTVGGGGFPL